ADPYPRVRAALGGAVAPGVTVGIGNRMFAEHALAIRDSLPGVEQRLAGAVMRELRMRKSPAEVEALAEAGTAIDTVHARMADWLRPGRTEDGVAAGILGPVRAGRPAS